MHHSSGPRPRQPGQAHWGAPARANQGPHKASRGWLWVFLGFGVFLGTCGLAGAGLFAAFLLEPRAAPLPMPKDAVQAIGAAKDAIDGRRLTELVTLLADDGIYEVANGLTATTPEAAIAGWKSNRALLERMSIALSGPCEVDGDGDGDGEFVSCGHANPDAAYVGWQLNEQGYRIVSVYTHQWD